MIENEEIEIEELRFIYKLILDGWSDSDILNKYTSLEDSGELNFPLRTDEDFIKNRRKEMKIAYDVLIENDSVKKIIEILIPKRQEEHFAQIAEVSAILLEDNLNTVAVVNNLKEVRYGSDHIYSSQYRIKGSNYVPIKLNRLQLVEMLRKNVEKAITRYGVYFFYDCYLPHLKATIGEEIEAMGGFWPAVEGEPYALITKIKDTLDSKVLKGTCHLCKVKNQLPPFIEHTYKDIFHS